MDSLDDRVIDRMIEIGNISDLRNDRMDTNDEYYASMLMVMVRDAEAYVSTIRSHEDYNDMSIDINEALGGIS
jgi:hypothetical protein